MKPPSIFLIVLCCISTIGCKSENRNLENTNPVPSNLPNPALTASFTPTSLLPGPFPSSTSTSTPISSIALPQWVNDSKAQLLLVPTGTFQDGYKNLVLVNALTSQRFDIPLTLNSEYYFWLPDGSGFGFLSEDESRITLISTKDGNITSILIPEKALRLVADQSFGGRPNPIQASTSSPEDPNFILLPLGMELSPDKKYFIYQEDYDPTYTSVFEISTNQTILITDPNDKYFDLFSEWSPNSRYLAVSQVDQEPGLFYHFDALPTFRLRVYDINTRQVIASFKNVTFPDWSPDGVRFLFQEWKTWFGESPPCIFNSISGSTKCFYDVLSRHKTSNTIQTTFSSIQWSPDQTMVGYIYSNVDSNPHKEYGGFCVIVLTSNNIRCMLEEFELDGQKIIHYSWSPDSNFISLEYDTACPYCDYSDSPQIAIASLNTGEYYTVGDNINIFQLGLWRPSVNP
jgi:hypothetical protein